MKKRYLVPIVLVSLAFVSATTYGVTRLIQNSIPQDDPRANPLVILSAKELEEPYQVGKFASGDDVITRTVKRNTTWGSYKTNMPTPTLSGFNLMGWQYSYTGIDADYQPIDDEFVFDQNTYLRVSEWGAAEASSFATDSWATIVSEASKGLSSLKETYYDDLFKDHPEYNNSFIIQDYSNPQEVAAKTRIVNLKGIGDFRVRVIGEDQDIIADEENKVATLTFEFVDVVEPALGFSKGPDSDSWDDSYIKYYLDNSFIWRLPDPINRQEVLQTVVKKTLADDGSGGREIKESEEKLFLPSISEMGLRQMLDGSDSSDSNNAACAIFQTPYDEGNTYEFYRLNASDANSRVKFYTTLQGDKEPIKYWTRSPFTAKANTWEGDETLEIKYSFDAVHVIDEYGHASSFADSGGFSQNPPYVAANLTANAVAPCFCIGQDISHKLNITWQDGEDTSVELRADSTISVDHTCKIQLYDKRDMTAPVYNIAEAATKPLFNITSGGVEIPADYYNYDAGLGLLTIDLPNDYELTGDVNVKILAKQQINTKFEGEEWTSLINKSFDELKTTYSDEFNNNGGTFVGLKRKVKLDYGILSGVLEPGTKVVDQYVRVIGENGDDVDGSGDASLTFEFTESLGALIGIEAMPYYFSPVAIASAYSPSKNILKYSQSILKMYLDMISAYSPEGSFFPGDLINGIKSVNKNVCELNDDGSYQMSSFSDKLFALSYEEITGSSDLIPMDGEGEIYPYYQMYGSRAGLISTKIDASREGTYAPFESGYDHYWLRSISKNENEALAVNSFTGTITPYIASANHLYVNIVPAFAI